MSSQNFLKTIVEINLFFSEFETFASNQEDCRKKWLTTEESCSSALKELNDARANREKLELQVRHVTELLKNEILIRQRLQKEEKDLVIFTSSLNKNRTHFISPLSFFLLRLFSRNES